MTRARPPALAARCATLNARPAYTLIELVLALGVASMLLTAIGSAVVLASRALPDPGDPRAVNTPELAAGLEQLVSELQQAIHLSQRDAHAITFTLADRDGDGSPQRVRYAWSGRPGDPLTRQYDDQPPAVFLDRLYRFQITYSIQSVEEPYPGPLVEGPETLLGAYDPLLQLLVGNYAVDSTHWVGQLIQPALASDVVRWRPTRAHVKARSHGSTTGSFKVQLRTLQGGLPSAQILSEQTLSKSDLSTLLGLLYKWCDFTFPSAPLLRSGEGLALTFQGASGAYAADLAYLGGARGLVTTSNAGASWSAYSNNALLYYFYGKTYTASPTRTISRGYIPLVRLMLDATPDGVAPVQTQAALLNVPERLAAMWELDFLHDPAALDVNADGVGDWQVLGGGAFDHSSLSSGVWHATQVLYTAPDHKFTTPTILEARLRHAANDGGAAGLLLYANWTSGRMTPLMALLQRRSDGTQALSLYTLGDGDGAWFLLDQASNLPSGFIDVRLLFDPAINAVSLRIDGDDYGTYTARRRTPSGQRPAAYLLSWGSSAQFDHVAIRVLEAGS